jgi:type VI secretion system protein ImpF
MPAVFPRLERAMQPMPTDEQSLVPSLLDRLFDDDPGRQEEVHGRQGAVIRSVREGVCRDLQWLLNSRRSMSAEVDRYPELADSLVNYGLPDLQSYEVRGDRDRSGLCRMIEDTIRRFEPRLQQVRVTSKRSDVLQQGPQAGDRTVAFEIEAMLVVEPLQDPVVFSTTLDLARGEFGVETKR